MERDEPSREKCTSLNPLPARPKCPDPSQIWDDKYQKNLAAYRVKMAAYKAGQPVPDDTEAARLVEMGKAPEHVPGVDAEAETEEEAAVADESDESTPEPVREPSPPKSKRRKTKDATPSKPTPKADVKSPEKKSKKSKKEKEAPAAPASSSKTDKTRKSKK